MRQSKAYIPIETLGQLAMEPDAPVGEEIPGKQVFSDCDSKPLSTEEEQALRTAMDEYQSGETISWTVTG